MHTDPEHVHNPEVAFEKRDMGVRGILLFFTVLFISCAAIYLVVWGVYEAFVNISEVHQPPVSPMAIKQPVPTQGVLQNAGSVNLKQFPEPRLQSDEPTDMNRFLWQEARLLEAKPWRDQTGAIHIPIADAMQIVTQKGLPTRGTQQQSAPRSPSE
jgi:hypothetical protein